MSELAENVAKGIDAEEIGMAIQKAIESLPEDFEVTLLIASGAWLVRVIDQSYHEQHVAVEGDCPLQHAIDEAVLIAKEMEKRP